MQFTTPSGHQVFVKDFLTYGDRRAIKRMMTGEMKIRVEDGESVSDPLSASIMLDLEEEIFRRVIEKIVLSDGNEVGGDLLEAVYGWPENDGEAVFSFINDNFNSQEPDEKKD